MSTTDHTPKVTFGYQATVNAAISKYELAKLISDLSMALAETNAAEVILTVRLTDGYKDATVTFQTPSSIGRVATVTDNALYT